MLDPHKIVPLLSGMTVEREIGQGPSSTAYLLSRPADSRLFVLKHLSVPTSDAQTRALIFSGAVSNELEAHRYYASLVDDLKLELQLYQKLPASHYILKFDGYQLEQKPAGVGFDIYLISDFYESLPNYLQHVSMTKVQAVNLGIDLCSALEHLRSAGLFHRDVRPENVFFASTQFMLGDLGLVRLDDLPFSSMSDTQVNSYTAPEVLSPDATLSETMDLYAVGLMLYQLYNGGRLPFENDQVPREDADHIRRQGAILPGPDYADSDLSRILRKATIFEPEKRYQTPTEFKQALVYYMQQNKVSNERIVPLSEGETEPVAEQDVSAIAAATIAAATAAEQADSAETQAAEPPAPAEPEVPPAPPEPQEPKPPEPTLADLKDDELLVPIAGETSVEEFLASVRSKPNTEVLKMDSRGRTSVLPGYETEATLPEGAEIVSSADTHPEEPEQAAEADTPEAQSSAETRIPAVPPLAATAATVAAETTGLTAGAILARQAEAAQAGTDAADQPVESGDESQAPVEKNAQDKQEQPKKEQAVKQKPKKPKAPQKPKAPKKPRNYKKLVIAVIIVLALAGGAAGVYYFGTQTVESIQATSLSSNSISVNLQSNSTSPVLIVCTDATGEVDRKPSVGGDTVFENLVPGTTYTFTVQSSGRKFILGDKTVSSTTEAMTELKGFAATAVSPTSMTMELSGSGPQPDSWTVTAVAGTENHTYTFSAADAILLDGLTPETTYDISIARTDGNAIGGTTTCQATTSAYTVLTGFATTSVSDTSVSLAWTYEGSTPAAWTVTCAGSDGSSTTQEAAGTDCVVDGLTAGVTYTMTLSAPSLQETDLATLSVAASSTNVTSFTCAPDEAGNLVLNWEYSSDTTPAEWTVVYTYDSASEMDPILVTSDSASYTLEKPIPSTTYTFTIQSADGLAVGGTTSVEHTTGEAQAFTEYGCSNVEMKLYVTPDNADWTSEDLTEPTTSFTKDQHLAFAIQVDYEASDEDKSVATTYVVRDSGGKIVLAYESSRTWPGSWTTALHTGDLSDLPQAPGDYTFEVYFDGKLLAAQGFSVTDGGEAAPAATTAPADGGTATPEAAPAEQ